VVKSKKTDFAFLFDKVLDVIEANNKLKAEGFMRELVLEEGQAGCQGGLEEQQGQEGGRGCHHCPTRCCCMLHLSSRTCRS
jgi:hypothetical protein